MSNLVTADELLKLEIEYERGDIVPYLSQNNRDLAKIPQHLIPNYNKLRAEYNVAMSNLKAAIARGSDCLHSRRTVEMSHSLLEHLKKDLGFMYLSLRDYHINISQTKRNFLHCSF